MATPAGVRTLRAALPLAPAVVLLVVVFVYPLARMIALSFDAPGGPLAYYTAILSSPVSLTPNTTYVVSYHSNGHYAASSNYFTEDVVNGPLKALADTASNPNGVYAYGGSGLFPTNSFQKTNYWVDVLFNPQAEV